MDWLFQPTDVKWLHQESGADGGRHVIALVDVQHQVDVWTHGITHRSCPLHILFHRNATDLQLDGVVIHINVGRVFLGQILVGFASR